MENENKTQRVTRMNNGESSSSRLLMAGKVATLPTLEGHTREAEGEGGDSRRLWEQ